MLDLLLSLPRLLGMLGLQLLSRWRQHDPSGSLRPALLAAKGSAQRGAQAVALRGNAAAAVPGSVRCNAI